MSEQLSDAREECDSLRANIGVMCAVLGTPADNLYSEHDNNNNSTSTSTSTSIVKKPVLSFLSQLQLASQNIETKFADKSTKLLSLKERLLDLVNEMWLDTNDLSPQLQPLIRITMVGADSAELARRLHGGEKRLSLSSSASEGEKEKEKEKDKVTTTTTTTEIQNESERKSENENDSNSNSKPMISLRECDFDAWEGELRKMNVVRAHTTNKLIQVRDKAARLGQNLDILDASQLRAVVENSMPSDHEEDGPGKRALDGAIELLTVGTWIKRKED